MVVDPWNNVCGHSFVWSGACKFTKYYNCYQKKYGGKQDATEGKHSLVWPDHFSLCHWVGRKKGLVQFESHNCPDMSQNYVTIICPVCLNSVIVGYIYNRFGVPANQPTIYNWFNEQQTIKLLLTFIDLAEYDDNGLTQTLSFESASHFFG